jgi:hypothetical protein
MLTRKAKWSLESVVIYVIEATIFLCRLKRVFQLYVNGLVELHERVRCTQASYKQENEIVPRERSNLRDRWDCFSLSTQASALYSAVVGELAWCR